MEAEGGGKGTVVPERPRLEGDAPPVDVDTLEADAADDESPEIFDEDGRAVEDFEVDDDDDVDADLDEEVLLWLRPDQVVNRGETNEVREKSA